MERGECADDSVADDGRKGPNGEGGDGIGKGFVWLVNMFLTVDYPELLLCVVNMGKGMGDCGGSLTVPRQPEFAATPEEYRENLNSMADKPDAKMI